jgi:hypothetical protein
MREVLDRIPLVDTHPGRRNRKSMTGTKDMKKIKGF